MDFVEGACRCVISSVSVWAWPWQRLGWSKCSFITKEGSDDGRGISQKGRKGREPSARVRELLDAAWRDECVEYRRGWPDEGHEEM